MPRLTPKLDLNGRRFSRWQVADYRKRESGKGFEWECVCDCGTVRWVRTDQLLTGHSKSCGCLKAEQMTARHTKHGASNTPTYNSWISMIGRCCDPDNSNYRNYGGRGITVIARWKESYLHFLEDLGERPSRKHSLGRIDNDGNYEPENCRWETAVEQGNNRRTNRTVEFNGSRMSVTTAARLAGLNPVMVRSRLRDGWNTHDALTQPKRGTPPVLTLK